MVALVFLARETTPNLNGNRNSLVLLRVPSGNIPIAPLSFKTLIAALVASSSFLLRSTKIQPTPL